MIPKEVDELKYEAPGRIIIGYLNIIKEIPFRGWSDQDPFVITR